MNFTILFSKDSIDDDFGKKTIVRFGISPEIHSDGHGFINGWAKSLGLIPQCEVQQSKNYLLDLFHDLKHNILQDP